ncbi:hypothetical protein PGT21_012705 [Puccinia graminis f. sp. tritici]|uniref:Uncharacterized protein n=1 Tax=Puccinia graminis f. sp. tritici TaxID=56615 RepID=A0A5B0P6Q1_PUCGR|nr:hypothetical protein PGTUg99_000854 [Puccinia graminis f. sp. tritici]KAA1105591.1 hypothetical protein PGT21_012705 [Puccinia graminis f. sp. tritici]
MSSPAQLAYCDTSSNYSRLNKAPRRMTDGIGMGQAPTLGEEPIPIDDCYLKGIKKLQHEFTQTGLHQLRPYSPGIMMMQEVHELRSRSMDMGKSGELDADHITDNG